VARPVSGDSIGGLVLCAVGIGFGLLLLWRGFGGYRASGRIRDTSTSRIATLAAGEVRVTGTIEPAEVLLVSPLQGTECVWYRARVSSSDRNDVGLAGIGLADSGSLEEERGVGFRVRDETGTIRVFPNGARIDAPDRFDEQSDLFGDPPPGLAMRRTSSVPVAAPADREAAIAELLTVHPPDPDLDIEGLRSGTDGNDRRRYREARLEPGDVVTILGAARPFSRLEDASGADRLDRYDDPLTGLQDPTVAAEVATARAAGALVTPEEAWGNAAIPGFGVGRPVHQPVLDPAASRPTLATREEADRILATFDIGPDDLVLAAAPDVPLLVATGSPSDAATRAQDQFLLGLLGALVAIGSAVAAATLLGST
jgi:hypothetical protein